VTQECQWAFNLYTRQPERVILPVTAQPIEPSDFDNWLFLESFKRIEAQECQPLPLPEAIAKTLRTLVLTPSQVISGKSVSTQTSTQEGRSVLWVDDRPSNQVYERRSLEAFGISFTISTSTDDALGKLIQHRYDAIISDMSRPPDERAGYTLLEQVRKLSITVPFIIYCSSRRPEHVAESLRRGAYGQTNLTTELVELVTQALGIS
jgi:CheY-like chemotaxis protein